MLNSLAMHDELDYWVLMGDLFYDRTGDTTRTFFEQLSLEAASRATGIVLGNHDFWWCGHPICKMKADSFGNTQMQWYAQDTVAAHDSKLFDFSVDPDSRKKTAVENTIWYTAVGNVAIIGFSNAYSWEEVLPYFTRACDWIKGLSPALVILIGHWHGSEYRAPKGMTDVSRDIYRKVQSVYHGQTRGAAKGMFTEDVYSKIQTVPGYALWDNGKWDWNDNVKGNFLKYSMPLGVSK